MIGNGLLAFAIIIVVVFFVYISMKLQNDKKSGHTYAEAYNIELASGFAGDSISVFVNDSLLLNACIPNDSAVKLNVNRFAAESALLVVDNQTEKVSTFTLSEKGGKVVVNKHNGKVYLQEAE